MLVSAVIPAWNGAAFLGHAIESALLQSYRPLEIVVVDDGSTDGTRRVCLEFKGRLKYIYRENDGTSGAGARNQGIRESGGELIALLDQDDRWLPGKIEKQVREILSDARIGVVFTRATTIDATGAILSPEFEGAGLPEVSGHIYHELLRGNRFCASSALMRRSAVLDAGLPHVGSMPNDYALWLRLARNYAIGFIAETLTEYRVHKSNYSGHSKQQLLQTRKLLLTERSRLHPGCETCESNLRQTLKELDEGLVYLWLSEMRESSSKGLVKTLPIVWEAIKARPTEILKPRQVRPIVRLIASSFSHSWTVSDGSRR